MSILKTTNQLSIVFYLQRENIWPENFDLEILI